MKLLEKLLCGHKWKEFKKIDIWDRDNPTDTRPALLKFILVCDVCGKIRIIQS